MPPVVSIVGKSSTGKTTFLEKLLRELTARGYRVATIKHSHHSIDFYDPKKDSFRHARAGAAATLVSSTTSLQIIKPVPRELKVEELIRHLGNDYDLVLTEGFSRGNAPKVEIHRKEAGPLLEVASHLFAVVTDEPLDTDARQFGLEDVKGVADLIENLFIKPAKPRFSLYINDRAVELSDRQSALVQKLLKELESDFQETGIHNLELHYHPGRQ